METIELVKEHDLSTDGQTKAKLTRHFIDEVLHYGVGVYINDVEIAPIRRYPKFEEAVKRYNYTVICGK